ncbi:hypothetical protein [Salicola sp. Rm-C-2C1-2]|uniref:hypothetical protein n=1 Tax=Salicola sp. Rm-C-2C1-2 TaxID=3141321 RepID=UPI0032E4C845
MALKTSLTEQMGAESGTLVNILNVTGSGDTFKVAEGTIADPVVESGAVVVIDKADAETVEIGSRVKVDYSCSIAGCSFDSYWPL